MPKIITVMLIACACIGSVYAQIEPAVGIRENTPAVHALKNLTIVVAPGKRIERGTIVVRDGVIESAGESVAVPADARVWDCSGLTAYPGLIDLYTDIGQPKPPAHGEPPLPGSVPAPPRGSVHWNAQVHPETSGAEFFLPDRETAEKFRAIGFTAALSAPSNGIFRGSSALVSLGDGKANALLMRDNVTQNISFARGGFGEGYPSSLMGAIALIRQTFIDANWYADALKVYAKHPAQERPEENKSLTALEPAASGRQTVIFETSDEQNILRAAKIAKEFSLDFWVRGNGYEYRRLDAVKAANAPLLLPVNFPDPPNVNTPEEALDVTLEDLRHWDFAPENPARLKKAGVEFALTTSTLKDISKFRMLVRTAIERGFNPEDALAALTTTPARLLGMEKQLGTIEAGKSANFVLADGELFGEKTKIRETWVDGVRYEVKAPARADARGTWSCVLDISAAKVDTASLLVTGETDALAGTMIRGAAKAKMSSVSLAGKNISLIFNGDSLGYRGVLRLTGVVQDSAIIGTGETPDGTDISWSARLMKHFIETPDTAKKGAAVHSSFDIVYPDGAFGRKTLPEQPENILVKGGFVWTSGPQGNLENTDILYTKGKVAKIGKNIPPPRGRCHRCGRETRDGRIDRLSFPHCHLGRGERRRSGDLCRGAHRRCDQRKRRCYLPGIGRRADSGSPPAWIRKPYRRPKPSCETPMGNARRRSEV